MSKLRHWKLINQTDTGMVVAKVFNHCGDRVGLEFFKWPWFGRDKQAKRLERAHAWADKWIASCERYCVGEQPESPDDLATGGGIRPRNTGCPNAETPPDRPGMRVFHVDIEAEQRRAVVKAEPLYEDDEDSEPFDISLQLYGDLPEGKSAASAISRAMTQWLRDGAPAGGYTAANDLRVHYKGPMASRDEEGV